jgi:hypothetical protein
MRSLDVRIDTLSAVKWYFESKNLSLRGALSLRFPLSVPQLADIRIHYSQYFVSLGSVTELLRERDGPTRFEDILYFHLALGDVEAGRTIYAYVKELRNAIVHRGMDVSAAAHMDGNFPLFLLPECLSDRSKKRTYSAPAKYVVQLIATCERAVGPAVEEHLSRLGFMDDDVEEEELRESYTRSVQESAVMPEHVKSMALGAAVGIDHRHIHRMLIEGVRKMLCPQHVPLPA